MKLKSILLSSVGILAFAPWCASADLAPSGGDDSVAIQAAIDAAEAGGTVTLGAGTFLINTQLTIGNGVTLIGQGRDATVLKYNGTANLATSRVATIKDYGVLSSVAVTGGKVAGNNASGGGVLISGGGTVSWCCVTNNVAQKGQGGGIGIQGLSSTVTYEAKIDHTIVANNVCGTSTYENYGGGIGVYTYSGAYLKSVEIDTCLVYGNTAGTSSKAGHGGGIGLSASAYDLLSVTIRNTTVADNVATGKAGGFYIPYAPQTKTPEKGEILLVNTILADNTASVTDGSSQFADIAYASASVKTAVAGNISYCFFGLAAEVAGTGSDSGVPGFVGEGDYHLGDDLKLGYTTEEALVDLDGNGRTDELDVGCYLSSGSPTVVANPTLAPADCVFYPTTNVTITCKTRDAVIYYTLDGSDPTTASAVYAGPITLTKTTTVKAFAGKGDITPSAIVSATYTYEKPVLPIVLDEPTARPLTDYNGSAVSVAFSGDFPDGAAVSAKITIKGADYAGTVGDGVITYAVPDTVVTAGQTYDATVTLTVGDRNYTKSVTLVQGTPKVDENPSWIAESASAFNATGTWSGDKAAVTSGKIAVSNATFTAAKASVADAKVTVTTAMVFNGPSTDALDPAARAGVQVVKVGGVNRYAFVTGGGIVTNTTATANVSGSVSVKVELDYQKNQVVYTVGGTAFGPFAATAGAKFVTAARYVGGTSVTSLAGAYRYEGLDANLAQVGEDEYATVADAIAQAGKDAVSLLWDASWNPVAVGDYNVATNGHRLVIGGTLAYSVKDNGDGTITVSVTGEKPVAPTAGSITIGGSVVRIAVTDVRADYWYALEKTADLTSGFVVVPSTCVSGADLLKGTGELQIAIDAGEAQSFYRVVASPTELK